MLVNELVDGQKGGAGSVVVRSDFQCVFFFSLEPFLTPFFSAIERAARIIAQQNVSFGGLVSFV